MPTTNLNLLADRYSFSVVSSSVVQLAAGSRVTIGGVQWSIASNLQITGISGLTANTLYFVYAYISGGAVTLTYSTNVNSVGPAGQTFWKLVGAFYSDGGNSTTATSQGVGSVVNIYGKPVSGWQQYYFSLTATGVAPTWTSYDTYTANWRRNGEQLELDVIVAYAGTITVGSGQYLFPFPSGLMSTFPTNIQNSPIFGNATGVSRTDRATSVGSFSVSTNTAAVPADSTGSAIPVISSGTPYIMAQVANSISGTSTVTNLVGNSNYSLSSFTSYGFQCSLAANAFTDNRQLVDM